MHSDILNNYLDRDVEVTTSNSKTFRGYLKLHDIAKETVILDGNGSDTYYQKYGPVAINQKDIVSVREILPHIDEDNFEEDFADDSIKKSPGLVKKNFLKKMLSDSQEVLMDEAFDDEGSF